MKFIGEEITDITEDRLFEQACSMCSHGEVIKVGTRYMVVYFGPEHYSWEDA